MCPTKNMYVRARGISVCKCQNIWLKTLDGQRGTVKHMTMTCGDATTTEELLQGQCQRQWTGNVKIISLEAKLVTVISI